MGHSFTQGPRRGQPPRAAGSKRSQRALSPSRRLPGDLHPSPSPSPQPELSTRSNSSPSDGLPLILVLKLGLIILQNDFIDTSESILYF